MTPELKRAWIATAIWFGLNAFGLASFIVRLPEVKQILDLSNSRLGLALFLASTSVLAAINLSGKVAAKYGSSPVMLIGGISTAFALPLVSLLTNFPVFVGSLFVLFVALIFMDNAMNAQAVSIEHLSKKLIMGRLHGLFSVGGVAGGFFGGICSSMNVSLLTQGITVGLITLVLILIFRSFLLPPSADIHEPKEKSAKQKQPRIFYLLGFVGLCAGIIEGSASDWGAVLITEEFGASGLLASLPFIVFQIAMVIGRFSSDSLTTKFGRAPILLFCGTFVGLGLSTGLLIGGQIAIVLAWFAMGIGASVVIPMVFSVAGSLAKNEYSDVVAPSQAVATVSGISYAAFLFGPPIIGFAADIISLRWAMLIPAFLALGIVFGSRIAKQVN
jgi:MFS family permease